MLVFGAGRTEQQPGRLRSRQKRTHTVSLMPWRFFQQAKTPCAFGGLEAEKIAERQAGVLEELFDIIAVGKTPSVFP
jgi:hypothetical protein